MRKITFTPDAFKEYNYWINEDFKVIRKIGLLLSEIQKDPFRGVGKPGPI